MIATATATATPTATAAAQSLGGHDLRTFLFGAAVAVVPLLVGGALTHLYTSRRDRRADLLKAIDNLIAVIVRADWAMTSLIRRVP